MRSSDRLKPQVPQSATAQFTEAQAEVLRAIADHDPIETDPIEFAIRMKFQHEVCKLIGLPEKPDFNVEANFKLDQAIRQGTAIQNNPIVGEQIDSLVDQLVNFYNQHNAGALTMDQIVYDPNRTL